jgi:hypothetical protein
MVSSPKSSASGSVIAAAVVAIAGSLLAILGLSLAFVGFALVGSRANPQTSASLKTVTEVMLAIFVGVAIFGVATGIGLIRLRNWARISALVWAGISALFSAFGVLIMLSMPIPAPPNVPAASMAAVRLGISLFYALPLLIAVWWLILFNRAATKSQFSGQDISTDPSIPQRPRCPVPIAVLAWFLIVSVLSYPFVFLMHLPTPVLLFGHIVTGPTGKIILLLNCLLFPTAGVGLLKLKSWSYPLTIGIYTFWFASGIVSAMSPNYKIAMNSVISQMHDSMRLSNAGLQSFDYMQSITWTVSFVLVFYGAVLGMLVYYRGRFLEAAAASNA